MFKAEIYKMVYLENSTKTHVSISGGRATHNFYHVMNLKADTLEGLKSKIKDQFGETYGTYENSIYIAIPESEWEEKECPENYEAVVTEVSETKVMI